MNTHPVQGDITTFKGDAIVNAANVRLLGGGGVDGAIHKAAGPDLKRWIYKNIPADEHDRRCPTGQARITPGFRLPAKFIIHTVGPRFNDNARGPCYAGEIYERDHPTGATPRELLATTIRSTFTLAIENDIKTLALPAISCGVFGCPIPVFAKVLHEVIAEAPWNIDTLYVVLFLDSEAESFRATWDDLP